MTTDAALIYPDWPAPSWVRAVTTTRQGGVSRVPFESFNLAEHVGDDSRQVMANRRQLGALAALPNPPHWLNQVHGNRVVACGSEPAPVTADASTTSDPAQVCVVMTADCLPILLCHRRHTQVAAVHVGWRGLAEDVIEAALSRFAQEPRDILAWLGPAISARAFEVGEDVYQALAKDASSADCFSSTREGHYMADLCQLARLRLRAMGIDAIYGGEFCTYSEPERFFSYRRDGETGRMASLIWIAD